MQRDVEGCSVVMSTKDAFTPKYRVNASFVEAGQRSSP
jgi:hypothetical protein